MFCFTCLFSQTLNLSWCGISSLEPICKVLPDTKLEKLSLSSNYFGDKGFVDLCSVQENLRCDA
jgi:hypothetical protein